MRRVITYGTFDLFHQGHYNILKRAKEKGDYLIVGVTSESYDLERGKLNVCDSLLTRIENVRKTGLADEIIIEEYQGQKVNDIIKYKIDALVIGSDWYSKFDYLKKYCEVIYLERTKNISSTKLRNENFQVYRLGFATDDELDNEIVYESKFVSGIHAESVFSATQKIAQKVCYKYELNSWYEDYTKFLDSVDIVYIKTAYEQRYKLAKLALENRKYVICDSPIANSKEDITKLFELAKVNNVILCENIITAYLRAFNQLVWLMNGNLIGKLLNLRCVISNELFKEPKNKYELAIYPLFAIMKIMGHDYNKIDVIHLNNTKGDEVCNLIQVYYSDKIASIEIGISCLLDDGMTIIGDMGKVFIPNDWWNTGYFEVKLNKDRNIKRYSFNFEGNGLRYLLHELMIMIKDNCSQCNRIFYSESEQLYDMLKGLG